MLHPTIEELTQGKFNRYELALATARCARIVTDESVRQHDAAEKEQASNKDGGDKPACTMIDKELRDEKAVHVAVNRLRDGVYVIDPEAGAYVPAPVETPAFEEPIDMSEDDEESEDAENAEDAEDAEIASEDEE